MEFILVLRGDERFRVIMRSYVTVTVVPAQARDDNDSIVDLRYKIG